MRNIKTKIISLIMVIPLLLVFISTKAADLTKLLVDIPVSSVEITNGDIVALDLAAENNTIQLNTEIIPYNAANKSITFSAQPIEGKEQASVLISKEGLVTPLSVGSVKVVALAGEAKTAAIQINIFSSKVTGAQTLQSEITLHEGEAYTLTQGIDFALFPSDLHSNIIWESGDEATVEVLSAASGKILAGTMGVTTLSGSVEGIEVDDAGVVSEKTYNIEIEVTVTAQSTETGISFGGKTSASKATLRKTTFNFSYDQEKMEEYGGITLEYDDENIFSSVTLNYSNGTGTIVVELKSSAPEGEEYPIIIKDQEGEWITTIYVTKALLTYAHIDLDENTVWQISNVSRSFGVITNGAASTYSVKYISSDPTIISVQSINNICRATPLKAGSATISIEVRNAATSAILQIETLPVQITVVDAYTKLSFSENSKEFGLENEFVFGKFNISGSTKTAAQYDLQLQGILSSSTNNNYLAVDDNKKIRWESSDNDIAQVSSSGMLRVGSKSGIVTITAYSADNESLSLDVKATFSLRCIADGVNIYNYDDLMIASNNKWISVIQADIMLAPLLGDPDFGEYSSYLRNDCTFEMQTTADYSYYNYLKTTEYNEEPNIRYAVEFTNDIYGNGHIINGQNITRSEKLFNDSVFNGPLDMLRLNPNKGATEMQAKVKAQDNIVFLVKEKNIKITNIELKGCDDLKPEGENKQINLTELNNCGTVLEIMGDDCTLSYSRVNNGRTTVRIFGTEMKEHPSAEDRITVKINNCVISYGREFLLKIGSNQSKKNPSVTGRETLSGKNYFPTNPAYVDYYDDASPYLTKQNGSNYDLGETAAYYDDDSYFYDNYVMTDVTVENCAFANAGLFAVGMESKFAGLCLHGWDYNAGVGKFSEKGWGNIAGTSYPAVLRLKGDVRFYNWKDIEDINSDTLIEADKEETLGKLNFNLDIADLMESYNDENLVVTLKNKKYVNGAIAFYGGGKNYSYIDISGVGEGFNTLYPYTVDLHHLGDRVEFIYYSAGAKPFKFLLYDARSALSITKQIEDTADATAYSWIIKSN